MDVTAMQDDFVGRWISRRELLSAMESRRENARRVGSEGKGPTPGGQGSCAFLESPPVTPAHLRPRVSVAVLVSWPTRPCQNITKAGGIVKLKIDTAGGATNVTNSPGQRGAEMPTVPGKSLCEHL